ncbi:MAG TPA: exodeoxyribonuclease III [Caldithrix abyssi]|uniref:Exodeoxyribonuclease III n=1 Tax=Caldithrix abyssi TaxID=187145 RepID=A0A7V1PU72_CALAY|nr:exodeoxyribonuclease III [Caldithrix abyssi]
MKIITVNTNGIRAAARKGFFEWLSVQNADFVCIQETKAQIDQLGDERFHPTGYHSFYEDAEKKGYSGVAIYSRHKPDEVIRGLGVELFDREGRYLEIRVGKLSVVSLYLPSGSSSEERQQIKFQFMDMFLPRLRDMAESGRDYIICGDWNIAHTKADIRNWRGNQKNSGFLPEERAWMDTLFHEMGFVDAFRELEQEEHQYTWWSNRGRAWDNNTGWRIDYQVLTPGLKGTVRQTGIYKQERFSDHAPFWVEYDYPL